MKSTYSKKSRIGFMVFWLCFLFSCSDPKEQYDGYLFAYFEGSGEAEKQEQLRFAVSDDAVHWKALNNNEPIIASDKISQTGGIRDPHILRGTNDQYFYMVATDMFTKKNGWDSNPGIVLMKSDNLLDWTPSWIDLEKTYPERFKEIKWVWAPQTIYDPEVKKYLIYFTVRFYTNDKLDFYSAYANEDFTGFESPPELMFSAKYGAIDGDIVEKDGIYHLFFKGNTKDETGYEFENGIQQATSTSLQGPWKEDFKYLDAYAGEPTLVEGSSVFKLNGKEEYFLMYDLYTSQRYEYQISNDLVNFSDTTGTFTKDFNPRHGSVISITKAEARNLQEKWGGVPRSLLE
ncbi:glycoside hydrolase family 43 protein [Echinicola sp. CAU 1574]|uniref:Glycoside hydrolase family 43 protein n=1 Tax=Echinicola arenosa TaxID=2774144 RepID=A0ABR9AK25_9BACT|nr:glycoside hydrolase family 43 protein [Echinicola arenosa]MBD8488178.1 glycoside hydrolase family 43 protein [Echinicola arenosa]